MIWSLALSLLAATTPLAMAAQDTAYYPGYANPNIANEMYYRDVVNVLQDMEAGEFTALYIKYHGCVWSEYGSTSQDDNDNNEDGNGCGGYGGDSYWYMGLTQCFRANAAYSLYGVKAGQTDSGSSGCLKKNYMNSFFTNMGVESFSDPFGIDAEGYGASSECNSAQNGNGRKLEEDDYTYAHGQNLFGDYTSYGTGCSKDGKFVLATFEGAYCNGGHYVATTDDLGYLNNDLDELGCKTIYSGYGGQEGGRKLDDEDIAADLLSYSTVCNMLEYPTKCPDPYGLKASHESSLKKAADTHFKKVPTFMPIMSTIFCAGALFFLYLTEKTKYSAKTKSIDTFSPEPMPKPPLILRTVESLSRSATALSMRVQSFKEKLIEYAEAESDKDDQIEDSYDDKSYQMTESVKSMHSVQSVKSAHSAVASVHDEYAAQPIESQSTTEPEPTPAQAPKEDKSHAEVVNAMLAENGIAAKPKAEMKKFKRPGFARITKFLFRKGNRKSTQADF